MEPLTVSLATAQEITGLGRTTLYKLMAGQHLRRVKVGRRTLITVASLQALLTRTDSASGPTT